MSTRSTGVDVVLFPDNDHDGIRAMRAIGNRMDGVARSVRVADLAGRPDRADIADISLKTLEGALRPAEALLTSSEPREGRSGRKGARQTVKLSSELRRMAHVMNFDSGTYHADFSADLTFSESGFAHLVLENQAEKLLAVVEDEGVEFLALRRSGTWSRDAEDLRHLISSVGKHYLRRMVNCSDQPPYDDDSTFFPAIRALRGVEQGQSIDGVAAAMRLAFQENRRLNKLRRTCSSVTRARSTRTLVTGGSQTVSSTWSLARCCPLNRRAGCWCPVWTRAYTRQPAASGAPQDPEHRQTESGRGE